MVSLISVALVGSLGLMIYLAIPFVVMGLPVDLRKKVGTFYFSKAAKCLKQFAFIRRVLSGYDVKQLSVDDEQKLLKVTLSSNLTSDDNEYRFKDPDNRIRRLFDKPVALNFELVPAAIDAELSELGHWVHEKNVTEGINRGSLEDGTATVDPWVKVDSGLRLVDPLDAYNLVLNDVDAENIKTAEKQTKRRFEKYRDGVSAVQLMSGVLGFFAGIGGMMTLRFFQNKVLDGGGGGGVGIPEDPVNIMLSPMLDVVVTLL